MPADNAIALNRLRPTNAVVPGLSYQDAATEPLVWDGLLGRRAYQVVADHVALSAFPAHINSQLPTGNHVAGGIGATHLVAWCVQDINSNRLIA